VRLRRAKGMLISRVSVAAEDATNENVSWWGDVTIDSNLGEEVFQRYRLYVELNVTGKYDAMASQVDCGR